VSRAVGLPERTARLFPFPGDAASEADPAAGRGLLIERILEDGDGDDLRWLLTQVSESALAAWFFRAGGRKLSRRSRAYWSLVLATPPGPAVDSASALWPLA
jgi:hypothetical protein